MILLLFTTSRKPSRKTRAFTRELSKSFNSEYFSRGKKPIKELADYARHEGFKKVLVLSESKGNPAGIQCIDIKENEWNYFCQCKAKVFELRREISKKKQRFKSVELKLTDTNLKDFFKKIGVKSEKTDLVLEEKKNFMTFLLDREEIGPRFNVWDFEYE